MKLLSKTKKNIKTIKVLIGVTKNRNMDPLMKKKHKKNYYTLMYVHMNLDRIVQYDIFQKQKKTLLFNKAKENITTIRVQ